MTALVSKTAEVLGKRSSRRQFVRFLGTSALGAGIWLTRTDATLASVTSCAGCSGCFGDCWSPHPPCGNCKTCQQNGGCGSSCTTTGEWQCCVGGCSYRCSECQCASCCHCFTLVQAPCAGAMEVPESCAC
jgi:hypothetical protein